MQTGRKRPRWLWGLCPRGGGRDTGRSAPQQRGPLPLPRCVTERFAGPTCLWEVRSVLSRERAIPDGEADAWGCRKTLRGCGPVLLFWAGGWSSQWSQVLWSFIVFFHFQDGKRCCIYTEKGREGVPQSSPQRKVQTPKGETLNTINSHFLHNKKCRVMDCQQRSHSEVCVCVPV